MASGDLAGTVSKEKFLPAACFNGTTDYIEITNNARYLGTNLAAGFTISAWVNPKNSGEITFGEVLCFGTGSLAGFHIFMNNNPQVGIRLNNGTSRFAASSSVPYKTWTHILVTVSAAQIASWYINGVASGTPGDLVQLISTITTTSPMRIGNQSTNTNNTFDGCIAKVRMWNRVLTAAEITSDYGGTIKTDDLLMNYELNGNAQDSSPFANDATVSGAYFTNVPFNNILADVRFLNLATVTDKLFVVPMFGRNSQVLVVSAIRTP